MKKKKNLFGGAGMRHGIGIRNHKIWTVLFCFLALAAFAAWAPEAGAFSDFGGTGQNCKACHTTFSGGTSSAGHNAHSAIAGGTCSQCHGGTPPALSSPVEGQEDFYEQSPCT